ncbi:hypothetical protein [Nannocystis exedens]|uniref:hypothetical protein n=1 Tax=Nannocystis exedens TaxID=54 RepID=UPI001474F96C|nr:hypothetical protein [Nannocystis exedens]
MLDTQPPQSLAAKQRSSGAQSLSSRHVARRQPDASKALNRPPQNSLSSGQSKGSLQKNEPFAGQFPGPGPVSPGPSLPDRRAWSW